jgi:hypothetical protein
MSIWSPDLCGCTLDNLEGELHSSLEAVLGAPVDSEAAGAPVRGRSRRRRRTAPRLVRSPQYVVPKENAWIDPRPRPPLTTRNLGQLVEGSTTYMTNDPSAIDQLCDTCGFAAAAHIGLDTEWTPTFVRGQVARVAMLQLATHDHCLLLRVSQMPRPLPERIMGLLASAAPLKVGRGVREDARRLRSQFDLDTAGVVELPGRANLKELAKNWCGLKPPTVAGNVGWRTNWEARELPSGALAYAAFDALAAHAAYQRYQQWTWQQPPGELPEVPERLIPEVDR